MNDPSIITELPGPNVRNLIASDALVVSTSLIKEYPLAVESAKGITITDLDGNRFIDFMSGIAVSLTGHCHPQVVSAIKEQAEKLLHICGTDFYYPVYTELCARLTALCPGPDSWRAYLGNSGAEAVEGAIKLARYHTGRQHVISFYGGFHGRTYGALSLTASKTKYRAGFGPLLPGVSHVPYGNCRSCAFNLTYPDCDVHCINGWRDSIFYHTVAPDEVAAVIVEPIQGEGGHTVPPPDYFHQLRALCDEYGILLIADEIQSGMGRTGKFFALEHWDVEPDIITLAKGLGSGMPISALLARDEIMSWPPGSHGSTFGGNPVACAAAIETLNLVESELMANAEVIGDYMMNRLLDLMKEFPGIVDVRGKGLMLAIEFDRANAAADFEGACFQKGLLVLVCGSNAVRFAPPMIATRGDIDIAVDISREVLGNMDAA